MFIDFLRNTSGATAIEYSFIAAMTGIIAIAAITLLGGETATLHDDVAANVSTAINQ